ncbi:MAG: arsenite methyltransferase, partial [Coprothermobacterota bacterium]|nr:arsenite methyltransferase [Coprothermobacterota bacterium]
MEKSDIHTLVREAYAAVATQGKCVCGCGNSEAPSLETAASKRMGYSEEELGAIPQEANLGLGCGNPTALADLSKGEVVLDLGSGGGIDCFLAASAVGEGGRVIGVDMTPPMIDQARATARSHGYHNVEFRLGEIENLPAADASVGVVISNCVINLSPDKPRVFREAFRVLKPGGRLMVSDIVLVGELPASVKDSPDLYVSCLAGAVSKDPGGRAARFSEGFPRFVRLMFGGGSVQGGVPGCHRRSRLPGDRNPQRAAKRSQAATRGTFLLRRPRGKTSPAGNCGGIAGFRPAARCRGIGGFCHQRPGSGFQAGLRTQRSKPLHLPSQRKMLWLWATPRGPHRPSRPNELVKERKMKSKIRRKLIPWGLLVVILLLPSCIGNPPSALTPYNLDADTQGVMEKINNIVNTSIVSNDPNPYKAEYEAGFIQGR